MSSLVSYSKSGILETCTHDLKRNSCDISPAELGEYDVIATCRMIIATLSLIGTLSIIILAIGKKQVFKYEVHPIFVLSLADLTLTCLWIIGGLLWLKRVDNKLWCLAISLITVIIQCVTINLTLVYAILAYSGTKKRDNTDSLNEVSFSIHKIWSRPVIIAVYLSTLAIPSILVLLAFGIVIANSNGILKQVNECSCWCLPVYFNVLPYAFPRDVPTAKFMFDVHKLLAAFGSIISSHYLVVFVLLLIIYYKLLKHIKRVLSEYEKTPENYRYGTSGSNAIILRQTKARRRVSSFLLIFVINGFFNFVLSLGITAFESYKLPRGASGISHKTSEQNLTGWRLLFIVLLILQSLTVPLQGFLNAIVYGWTRSDIVNKLSLKSPDVQNYDQTDQYSSKTKKTKTKTKKKPKEKSSLLSSVYRHMVSSDESAGDTEVETDNEGFNQDSYS